MPSIGTKNFGDRTFGEAPELQSASPRPPGWSGKSATPDQHESTLRESTQS
jgi:hypothetical protein